MWISCARMFRQFSSVRSDLGKKKKKYQCLMQISSVGESVHSSTQGVDLGVDVREACLDAIIIGQGGTSESDESDELSE